MKKSIYKYELTKIGEQTINMPRGCKILSVGIQGLEPVLWAEVNHELENVEVSVIVAFTGYQTFDEPDFAYIFVGTVQNSLGLVFHVYAEST